MFKIDFSLALQCNSMPKLSFRIYIVGKQQSNNLGYYFNAKCQD